jgi:hypothetical protein
VSDVVEAISNNVSIRQSLFMIEDPHGSGHLGDLVVVRGTP